MRCRRIGLKTFIFLNVWKTYKKQHADPFVVFDPDAKKLVELGDEDVEGRSGGVSRDELIGHIGRHERQSTQCHQDLKNWTGG